MHKLIIINKLPELGASAQSPTLEVTGFSETWLTSEIHIVLYIFRDTRHLPQGTGKGCLLYVAILFIL